MLKKVALAVAAALAAQAASAASIDYHGYFRAGAGNNTKGGSQVCYGHGGPSMHVTGRLGDECDMNGEMSFGANVAKKGDQVWKAVTTVAFGTTESGDLPQFSTQGNSWQQDGPTTDSPWDGSSRLSVREMYAQATGLMGDSTVWFGKRFGERRDIHILDMFYVMNSGYGAGFDNLSAGPLKLSFAWVQSATDAGVASSPAYNWGQDNDLDGVSDEQEVVNGQGNTWLRHNNFEFRLAAPLGASQKLEFITIYGRSSSSPGQDDQGLESSMKTVGNYDGWFLSAEHSISMLGGFNKAVVQYGTNGFGIMRGNFGGLGYAPWFGEGKGWRFIDHGMLSPAKMLDVSYALIVGKDTPDATNGNSWFASKYTTLVVRPVIKETDSMSTAIELGYDKTDYTENPWHNARQGGKVLRKMTVAQQFAPDGAGFWSRPVFRLFASKYSGERKVDDYDTMVGAQVEAWW